MRILIITGGRIDEDFALSLLEKKKFEHMIVVDGALAFWDKVEKNPDITCHFDHLVGDFDTISPEILKNYLDREDIEVHRFNPEKDYTDTDIALKLAIHLIKSETGKADAKSEIWLLGATGTRADHMLANMQLLAQTCPWAEAPCFSWCPCVPENPSAPVFRWWRLSLPGCRYPDAPRPPAYCLHWRFP